MSIIMPIIYLLVCLLLPSVMPLIVYYYVSYCLLLCVLLLIIMPLIAYGVASYCIVLCLFLFNIMLIILPILPLCAY